MPITIFIHGPRGERETLEVELNATVGDLRREYARRRDLNLSDFSLVFSGRRLNDDNQTLQDNNLTKESVLHVLPTIPGLARFTAPGLVPLPQPTLDLHGRAKLRRLRVECDQACKATIIDFYRIGSEVHTYKKPGGPEITVHKLLEEGPTKCMNEGEERQLEPPAVRWIHLPANNMTWIERLFDKMHDETLTATELAKKQKGKEKDTAIPGITRVRTNDNNDIFAGDMVLRPKYWINRQYIDRGTTDNVRGRFMKPGYSRVSTSTCSLGAQIITPYEDLKSSAVIFMPFLDWERATEHQRRRIIQRQPLLHVNGGGSDESWRALPNGAKLLVAYNHMSSPLHDRRTLDQAFYYTLPAEKIEKRDQDQVLYKYMRRVGGWEPMDIPGRILMVDQLWCWVLSTPSKGANGIEYDTKTVITAFPDRWKPQDPPQTYQYSSPLLNIESTISMSGVLSKILGACNEYTSGVVTATDLVCLVLDKCASLLHPRSDETEDAVDCLDVFAASIGKLASDQTDLANDIWHHSIQMKHQLDRRDKIFGRAWSELDDGEPTSLREVERLIEAEMNALADITKETACLAEIKDVLDELNSISNVFDQQITVVANMCDEAGVVAAMTERQRQAGQLPMVSSLSSAESEEDIYDAPRSHGSSAANPFGEGPSGIREGKQVEGLNDATFTRPMYRPIFKKELPPVHESEDVGFKYWQVLKTLHRRHADIETLKGCAHRVYKDVCDLLDLKQKQAAVIEAFTARQEAKETARQGQTILLFTVITVIFLPLSFIAAIFSMQAKEISSDRPISQIFSIMFPTTAIILFISLMLAYNSSITGFFARTFSRRHRTTPGIPRGAPQFGQPPAGPDQPPPLHPVGLGVYPQPQGAMQHVYQ